MSKPADDPPLQQLVALFETTHREFHTRAAKAVDTQLVARNWLFGWYLVEFENAAADRSEIYGKSLIPNLAAELKSAGLRGCSATNLKKFREFYQAYQQIETEESDSVGMISEIRQTLSVESLATVGKADLRTASEALAPRFNLGWSHYVTLLGIKEPDQRNFYEIEAGANDWSVRELKRQIDSSLFDRLALSRDKDEIKRLASEGQLVAKAADLIKNPYVLEFLELDERNTYSESDLETAIIDKLEHFLLELGKGFLFEARQKRFTFDEDHYYVDLVFYNRLLRCYALIDLKIGELTHQDLGQMQMYVNYYDRHVKLDEEAPTIGIILCKRKKDALVEITLPKESNIHASEYKLYLPSKEELEEQVNAIDFVDL